MYYIALTNDDKDFLWYRIFKPNEIYLSTGTSNDPDFEKRSSSCGTKGDVLMFLLKFKKKEIGGIINGLKCQPMK